jgi:hypothetical protein
MFSARALTLFLTATIGFSSVFAAPVEGLESTPDVVELEKRATSYINCTPAQTKILDQALSRMSPLTLL